MTVAIRPATAMATATPSHHITSSVLSCPVLSPRTHRIEDWQQACWGNDATDVLLPCPSM